MLSVVCLVFVHIEHYQKTAEIDHVLKRTVLSSSNRIIVLHETFAEIKTSES